MVLEDQKTSLALGGGGARGLAFVIAVMGLFGGLVMSATKRDLGIKD